MEEQILTPPEETAVEVVDVQFRPGQKVYYFDPAGAVYRPGDHLIIDTARGPEYGICAGGNHRIQPREVVSPLRTVLRLANALDEKTVAENRAREKKAYEVCQKKIAEHGLDMQLVSAECAFDGSKILFFFTADERVDFRELVKNLASVFHTRIELRQIGVRDKAKMVGGLGICGRPFCCASFLDDFQPVSIKMAKTQNLSLNPTKISGTCGRLMCCLKYEQEAYEDLLRTSPSPESFVDTPEGRGTVVELDLLRQRVKVRMEQNPETVTSFANADIAVLRNGKAKRGDPPIPADLAPISGTGKRAKKEETPEEKETFLDPIRFRYRSEAIVEELLPPEQPEETVEVPAEPKANRSRRRKKQSRQNAPESPPESGKQAEAGQKNPADKQKNGERKQKPAEAKEKPAENPAESTGESAAPKKKPNRRNNYRRRKPKQPGDGASNG